MLEPEGKVTVLGRSSRRRRLRNQPTDPSWREFLMSVPLYRRLPPHDQREVEAHSRVLLDEKAFEAAAGFEIREPMPLLVVAQAAILLLHRQTAYYPKLASIILYPANFFVSTSRVDPAGFVTELREVRSGESWMHGAIVLSWDEVELGLRPGSLRNVVLHEFVHQLDAQTGDMDGTPPLASAAARTQWAAAMRDARRCVERDACVSGGVPIDRYGLRSPAEMFAVATEAFFLNPHAVQQSIPSLYRVLAQYYEQDPITWLTRDSSATA